MSELFIKALNQLKDKKGTAYDVYCKMVELDKANSEGVLLQDILSTIKECVSSGHIDVKYDPKNRVDVITLKDQSETRSA